MEEESASCSAAQLRGSGDGQGRPSSTRVCDGCIRKKVKCDLGRPKCSRCFERGYTCTYSSTRRKPGPVPGFKRASRSGLSPLSRPTDPPGYQLNAPRLHNAEEEVLPDSSSTLTSADHLTQLSDASNSSSVSDLETRTQYSDSLDILPEEEECLLKKYFETIHHAIPLFSEARLPHSVGERGSGTSAHRRDLILTLVIMTAKLSGFVFASDTFNLDACIDQTLSSVSLQEDMFGSSPTLDQFRKFCLLAFYEFHQFPGQQAWMRIGKLVRMAYWMGLDRLDMLPALSPDWSTVDEDHLEDWRLVWWCVYRLDSYVNLSAGTPYQIDEGLVGTALMQDRQNDGPLGCRHEDAIKPRLSLPYRPDDLMDLLLAIASDSQHTSSFNIHIISATAVRHVGRALRLYPLAPKEELVSVVENAERRLSALRLGLPKNYFNPRRNAFMNESCSAHHARLVTVLQLLMAQLLVTLVSCQCLPEGEDWLLNWQQVLEVCQDVAAIAKQWNSTFSLSVDPGISLISFVALIFLDLHKKFAGVSGANLQSEIEHCETVLLLQLEQFACSWTLPGLLILSFKSFRESLKAPLLYRHIHFILSRFESPLHPRWLQFLSSAHIQLENC